MSNGRESVVDTWKRPVDARGLPRKELIRFGHSYFAVLPRSNGYLAFMYRDKLCFVCMAIISYAKSYQSLCRPYPLRFSLDRPDWGPRTLVLFQGSEDPSH